MKVSQLFLSDLELDQIKRELTGVYANGLETDQLQDTFNKLGIDMDVSRGMELLGNDGFGPCVICGNWKELDADYYCTPCWYEYANEED